MILAIAILGLSVNLVKEKVCDSTGGCTPALGFFWIAYNLAPGPVRYSIFMGIYGILIATIGTASLFVDSIPSIVPLAGDSIGALFYLAGGIAWTVDLAKLYISCSGMQGLDDLYSDQGASVCKRCEADHGLVWALFAFTAGLAMCDFVLRRGQVQSFK